MERIDVSPGGGCRGVISEHVAYFTGHVNQQDDTVAGQTRGICARYDGILAQHGWSRDNVLFYDVYLDDASKRDEFLSAFQEWMGGRVVPGRITQAVCGQPKEGFPFHVELSLWVAERAPESIQRIKLRDDACMTIYGDVAYIGGLTSDAGGSAAQQLREIYRYYLTVCATYQLIPTDMLHAELMLEDTGDISELQATWAELAGEDGPAGNIVGGKSPASRGQVELTILAGANPNRSLRRFDVRDGWSSCVEYGRSVYFSFLSAPTPEEAFRRYDGLLADHGLTKSDLVLVVAEGSEAMTYDALFGPFLAWSDPEAPVAGIVVRASWPEGTASTAVRFLAEKPGVEDECLECTPIETQVHQNRAAVHTSGRLAQINAKLAQAPENMQLYLDKGLMLRRQMLFREAIENYSAGLTYNPQYSLLYRYRGHAYVNIGQYQEAAADFELALRLDPENWDCWYHLGLAYYLMGQYQRACKAYRECLARSTTDESKICTADWLCLTLMQLGELDEMRQTAMIITPEMVLGISREYHQRVLVYNGTNTPDEVLPRIEALPDHVFATASYGIAVYLDKVLGQHERATQLLRSIAERTKSWAGFAEQACRVALGRQA